MLTSAAVLDSYISLRAPKREREGSSRAVWLPRCLLPPSRLGCLADKAGSFSAMAGPRLALQQYSVTLSMRCVDYAILQQSLLLIP